MNKLVSKAKVKGFCVYHLIKDDEVFYVGSSKTPRKRIRQHIDSGKDIDDVELFYFNDEKEMINNEANHIVSINPRLNSVLPGNDSYILVSRFAEQLLPELIKIINCHYVDYGGGKRKYISKSKLNKFKNVLINSLS